MTQKEQIATLMNAVAELTARLDRAGKYAKSLEQRIQVLEEQARYKKPGFVPKADVAAKAAALAAAKEQAMKTGQTVRV